MTLMTMKISPLPKTLMTIMEPDAQVKLLLRRITSVVSASPMTPKLLAYASCLDLYQTLMKLLRSTTVSIMSLFTAAVGVRLITANLWKVPGISSKKPS